MFRRNDTAQMLVVESIIMATIVLMALIFLYQLSTPASIPVESDALILNTNNALIELNTQTITIPEHDYYDYPNGYYPSLLAHYLYLNDTTSLITSLNSNLPTSTMYRVYLANQTNMTLITTKTAQPLDPPATKVSCTAFLPLRYSLAYALNPSCQLMGITDEHNTYQLILEIWYI